MIHRCRPGRRLGMVVSIASLIAIAFSCDSGDSGKEISGRREPAVFNPNVVDEQLAIRLDSVLESHRASEGITGVSAAVLLPDDYLWQGASGKSSDSAQVSSDMLFGIGSVTKTYTAALILKYAGEEHLSLDDPISKWLPPRRHIDGTATVRQLLNHTSGTFNYMAHPDYYAAMLNMPDTLWTAETLLDAFLEEPVGKPGAEWGYSATNYLLLGMIVEGVSGQTVATEIRRHLLDPLGLTHTFLYPDEVYSTDRMAHLWLVLDPTGEPVDVNVLLPDPPFVGLFSSVWTAGAMHATALDAARWLKGLLEGQVLPMTSIKKMMEPVEASGSARYGLGIMAEEIGGSLAYGHPGGIGYSSVVLYYPDDSVTISVLCNSETDPRPLAGELYRQVTARQ